MEFMMPNKSDDSEFSFNSVPYVVSLNPIQVNFPFVHYMKMSENQR